MGGGCCCPRQRLCPAGTCVLVSLLPRAAPALCSPLSPFHARNFKDLCIYLLLCSNYLLGCARRGLSGNRQDATWLFDRSNLPVEAVFSLHKEKKNADFFFYIFFPFLIFAKEHQLEVKYFPVLTGALIL